MDSVCRRRIKRIRGAHVEIYASQATNSRAAVIGTGANERASERWLKETQRGEIRYGETSAISRNEIASSRLVVVDDISKSMSYEGLVARHSSAFAYAFLIIRVSLFLRSPPPPPPSPSPSSSPFSRESEENGLPSFFLSLSAFNLVLYAARDTWVGNSTFIHDTRT